MTALLVTSISALFLQSTLFTEFVGPKLKAAYTSLSHAFDAFAEARLRRVVRASGSIRSSGKRRSASPARKREPRR